MTEPVLALTQALIQKKSITPEDDGCQQLMVDFLAPLGFNTEPMSFEEVKNFWSTHQGSTQEPIFVFAGHTDVVPPGPLSQWHSPPFEPTIKDGELFGRGAADMKGSLAAMLVATQQFIKQYPKHKGTIAFLITSDEEGPFINGTVRVIEELKKRQQKMDYCIVGEPSSQKTLGDLIRIGRRGSLTGYLTITGLQGHVAYPETTINAIHQALKPLLSLCNMVWDQGNENFPPTSFQICTINAGTATNVVPGDCQIEFNFRFNNEQSTQGLIKQVEDLLTKANVQYQLSWKINGEPFLTDHGQLIKAVSESIQQIQGIKPHLSTGGGTSDGRFIAQTGAEVIELGPLNHSIHKVNESVNIDDLTKLALIYQKILESLLLKED